MEECLSSYQVEWLQDAHVLPIMRTPQHIYVRDGIQFDRFSLRFMPLRLWPVFAGSIRNFGQVIYLFLIDPALAVRRRRLCVCVFAHLPSCSQGFGCSWQSLDTYSHLGTARFGNWILNASWRLRAHSFRLCCSEIPAPVIMRRSETYLVAFLYILCVFNSRLLVYVGAMERQGGKTKICSNLFHSRFQYISVGIPLIFKAKPC